MTKTLVGTLDHPESDGPLVCDFIESFCRITKGRAAGDLLELRPWQRLLLDDLYRRKPGGGRQYRRGLVGFPRKNGKSALGSGLALYGLFDENGAEVYSCAGDKDQARIVFQEVKRSVEADEELSSALKVYRDAIEWPKTSSVYRVLSAEAYTKEGLNPSLVIFDEVHVQPNDELWNVMNLGSGTRDQPLVLGITTAGVKTDSTGQDSLCYRLWQHGMAIDAGEVEDPSFFFRWWGAHPEEDFRDPAVWYAANPALGDFLHIEDFETTILTTPENEYRTKRLNQWVSSATAWLPGGSWDGCRGGEPIPAGAKVVLGFDGSFSNDSTGLVAASCGPVPHLEVVGCWERPADDRGEWRVPVGEVELAIREARKRWRVVSIQLDPYLWRDLFEKLDQERFPVEEFPQNATRMTPATQKFYEAVLNRGVTHGGDGRLARHLGNAVLKTDARGSRLTKESKGSGRKIDLAIAAVMAFNFAATHARARSRVINLNELAARVERERRERGER